MSQLRSLDGIKISPEESVKAENLYGIISYISKIKILLGKELEDKQRAFNKILPEEEFVDRRIHKLEIIDPESDSDEENLQFIDKYDKKGNIIYRSTSQNLLLKGISQSKLVIETSNNVESNLLNSIGSSKFQHLSNKAYSP